MKGGEASVAGHSEWSNQHPSASHSRASLSNCILPSWVAR